MLCLSCSFEYANPVNTAQERAFRHVPGNYFSPTTLRQSQSKCIILYLLDVTGDQCLSISVNFQYLLLTIHQVWDTQKSNLQFPRQTAFINKTMSHCMQSTDRAICNKL